MSNVTYTDTKYRWVQVQSEPDEYGIRYWIIDIYRDHDIYCGRQYPGQELIKAFAEIYA